MIDALLRQAEGSTRPPADFDRDERARWSGIQRHDVELETPDVYVPSQDGPTRRGQPVRDERLGVIS